MQHLDDEVWVLENADMMAVTRPRDKIPDQARNTDVQLSHPELILSQVLNSRNIISKDKEISVAWY